MHIVIMFINIGDYHAARLQSAYKVCQNLGWKLTAIQVTDDTLDHPWGDFINRLSMPVKTLLPISEQRYDARRDTFSSVASNALKHCLNELNPDVVFLTGWSFSVSRAGLNWCRRNNALPIIMSETKEDDDSRFWFKEVIKSWIVKKYKAALVGGEPHKRYLIKLGMNPNSIFMGYDIIDNDYFHPHKIKLLVKPIKNHYFLAINRFITKKNLSLLIASYANYREQKGDLAWDLVLSGDGELRPQIEQQINELDLTKFIHLPGFLQQEELLPYFAHANCFIHASIQEQWGLVVNEAMAAGLPVIVSNRCGCFEDLVIEGVNGFGFDPKNQQALTQLMLKMNSQEVDLVAMGGASLQHIQKYSPDYFAQGLMQAVEYSLAHS